MSMPGKHRGAVVRDLEQVFDQGTATGLSEGQLLRRFVAAGDESAFSILVSRHGPMVLGVCRRVLGIRPDADDAFQATFLVLLRRATALRDVDSLGPWLHGVAWRVASRARAGSARRRLEEEKAAATRPYRAEAECPAERRELQAIIDEEINRLPEKYRRPLVLCYLEGLTQEAAARRLRWKAAVLRGRLERARLRLRDRLSRRGLAPAATIALAEWFESPAQSALTPALLDTTVGAAFRELTVGRVSRTVAATWAATLAGEVLRSQLLGRAVLVATLLACGILPLAALGTPGRVAVPKSSAQASAPAATPKDSRIPPSGRTIELRVVESRTGKPLPGVSLTLFVGTTQTIDKMTDQDGVLSFNHPSPRPELIKVGARKDGLMPMLVWLRHPAYEEDFPPTFTLAMAPAIPMGGLVNDEDGRPVSGAKVSPWFEGTMGMLDSRAEIRLGEDAMTDARGHWTCSGVPAGFDGAKLVMLRFRHPDFQTSKVQGYELEEAIGPEGKAVLPRGIAVTGRVVDREGRPVPGARVGAGRDWFGSDPPVVETDGDGRFRLGHLRPGETVVTVQAKGHGPAAIELDARAGLSPLELKLSTPRTIVGRVVDRDGRPLPGIQLGVVWWRGFRTLDWKAETGTDGRFRWEDAPLGDVWINVRGNGFIALQNCVVAATESETVIKLARTLRVAGTVVDFRTQKPIESFKVTPGTEIQDGSHTYWDRSRSRRQNGGRYEVRFPETAEQGHILRVEAEGYALGISRPITDDEGDARIDFELVPAAPSQR